MTIKKPATPFYERFALIIIGLVAFGFLIDEGKEILDPLVFGFLFALLLLPIAVPLLSWMTARTEPSSGAVAVFVISTVTVSSTATVAATGAAGP